MVSDPIFVVPGPAQKLFIEYGTALFDNHSIVKLADSIAIYDLFSKISAGVNTTKRQVPESNCFPQRTHLQPELSS